MKEGTRRERLVLRYASDRRRGRTRSTPTPTGRSGIPNRRQWTTPRQCPTARCKRSVYGENEGPSCQGDHDGAALD